jgi:hypothetical protein
MFDHNIFTSGKEDSQKAEDSELLLSPTSTLPNSPPSEQFHCCRQKTSSSRRICHAFFFYMILPICTLIIGILIGRMMSSGTTSAIEQVSKYCELITVLKEMQKFGIGCWLMWEIAPLLERRHYLLREVVQRLFVQGE